MIMFIKMCIIIITIIIMWLYRISIVISLSLLRRRVTASLRTKILDFTVSSRILNLRGGTPRLVGKFPEGLSQA